jgi:hypothetical protein
MSVWTAIADFVLDDPFGFQDANEIKGNIITLASARSRAYLGGSRQGAVPRVASAQDAIDYIDVEIDGTNLAGLTVQARVEVRTANAGTSVTPKIRNVTDASDAVVGAACSSTTFSGTNGTQTLTFTPAVGSKKYRLMLTPSNTTNDVYGIGVVELFATA